MTSTAIPFLKTDWPPLACVHSQVLQNVAVRVDLAFQAFFRRVKAGALPGFPRYKGEGRYDSITYPQDQGFALKAGRLRLGWLGQGLASLRASPNLHGAANSDG